MLIDQQVGEVLATHLGFEPDELAGSALLDEDLGLDSLALTEVLLTLEDELAISIPEPVQMGLRTVDDLVAVVASQLGHRPGGTGPGRPAAVGPPR